MNGSDGGDGPGPDPDVLEELELWGGPDDGDDRPDPPGGDRGPPSDAAATAGAHRAATGGRVVLVGTPIGNLGDLSPRAVQALEGSDVIYCEDTRHSRKLLTHAGITGTPLRSLHQHNEDDRIDEVIRTAADGGTVAVISDAGMPGISDPGRRVVAAAARSGVTVTVVPGPSAVLAALVASGLPTDRFCFEGFLPRSGTGRRERLASLATESRTVVLFEAPGRVAATLRDLVDACGGDRPVSVARELTKLHEEVWRGPLAELAARAAAEPVRGEVVLVLGGAAPAGPAAVEDAVLTSALADRLSAGERTRGVVDDLAAAFGVPRRRVYGLALALRDRTAEDPGGDGRVGSGPPGPAPE
ncbi:MAG TPA: 16S rRNA (cytidine(1402)-2'-O)-methyltransferase [Acidimicrobiales bacterium]|nr:16S rRNA (cytidine(1402)-2'-O)-methyltransferase [Acidimicrobiales bacterium]